MQNIHWVAYKERLQLGVRDVHIWRVNLSHELSSSMLTILSKEEQEKLRSFKRDDFRRRYGVARVALRRVLAKYLSINEKEILFSTLEKGKPFIPGAELSFNISHTDNRALIAIAGSELSHVGIDIELKDRTIDAMSLAERFFTKEEFEYIAHVSSEYRADVFVRFWVLKEAFLKALGVGLSGGLDTFRVQLAGGDNSLLSCDAKWGCVDRWQLKSLGVEPGYCGAIAVSDRSDSIKYFDYFNAGVDG